MFALNTLRRTHIEPEHQTLLVRRPPSLYHGKEYVRGDICTGRRRCLRVGGYVTGIYVQRMGFILVEVR